MNSNCVIDGVFEFTALCRGVTPSRKAWKPQIVEQIICFEMTRQFHKHLQETAVITSVSFFVFVCFFSLLLCFQTIPLLHWD